MQRGDYALEKSDGSKIPRDRTPSFRVFLEASSYVPFRNEAKHVMQFSSFSSEVQ